MSPEMATWLFLFLNHYSSLILALFTAIYYDLS